MTKLSEKPVKAGRLFSPFESRLILAVGGAWLLTGVLKRTALIDPAPLPLTSFAALVGFGLGVWLCVRSLNRSTENLTRRAILGMVALPFLALFFAKFLARMAYEEVMFRGAQTTSVLERANVISKDTKWRRSARVNFGPGTRDIAVRIDAKVYSSLEPWRQPGRDCLLIAVEKGRGGIRRAIGPNFLETPLGMDRYRICK